MKDTQRFQADSVKAALNKVRMAFGSDALIIEQNKVNGRVEILAARVGADVVDLALPLGERYAQRLARSGFDDALISTLSGGMGWEDIVDATAAYISLEPMTTSPAAGAFRFVGPHGSGKTSSVAKLMVNHALTYGVRGLVVATADLSRLGGSETLFLAGEMLGVAVTEIHDGLEMKRLVSSNQDKLVLVDTPGVRHASELNEGAFQRIEGLDDVLVMPLSLCPTVVRRYTQLFSKVSVKRAAVTFSDQPGQIGSTLSELSRRSIPVSWVGTGPMLPDDFASAEGGWLRKLIGDTTETLEIGVA